MNWQLAMIQAGIPDYMTGGLVRWIEDAILPGSFLTAVLSNDLREACACADDVNRHRLLNYVQFLYNHAPSQSWGSVEAVKSWQGLRGTQEDAA